jgi:chromosome segregation ATPase
VDLEVTDLDQMTTQLNAQLQQLQGFVSNFSEHRRDGDRRTATWTIRIDASKFSEFLKWLDGEANVVRKQITSKDVTEDYIDLKARLSNKQATEKRLAKLLEENAGKLEEVLAFEREIDRTREEIERIEGKLRLLEDQLALSTIKLIASTRLDYLATQPVMLSTSVSETWSQSIGSLQKLGKVLLLLCVGAVPWLPILAMVVAIITWLAKKESRPIEERSV